MSEKKKLLRFFAVWFILVGLYIFLFSFFFSIYSVTILPKKADIAEKKLTESIQYLKLALKEYPDDTKLLSQLQKNESALFQLRKDIIRIKKLKLSLIDLPLFSFLLFTSILYLYSSFCIFKQKKQAPFIVYTALLFSTIALFAKPAYKYLKGFPAGFPYYGLFMVVSLVCYAYTFRYFRKLRNESLFKN